MREFLLSCLFGIIGVILSIVIFHLAASFLGPIDETMTVLSIVLPSLGVCIGCIFFSQRDWGEAFSLKNISYTVLGAFLGAIAWYISFIVVIRGLYNKQVGAMEISLLSQIFDPSTLPSLIVENKAGKTREIRPTLELFLMFFGIGVVATGFNLVYLWNNYGLKYWMNKAKPTSELPCMVCNASAFQRPYEHRYFVSIGTDSYSKSYLFNFPFCDICWSKITTKKFWVMKILLLLGMIGGIFGIMALIDILRGALFGISLLGLPIIVYILYQRVKRQESEYMHFRIDDIDDDTGNIKYSIIGEQGNWESKEIKQP